MARVLQLLSFGFIISLIIVNLMICIPLINAADQEKCPRAGSVCQKTTDCCTQDVCADGICVNFVRMIIPCGKQGKYCPNKSANGGCCPGLKCTGLTCEESGGSNTRSKGKAKARSPQKKKSAKSMSLLDDYYDDEYCSGYGHQCSYDNNCCSGYCRSRDRYGYCA